MRQEAAIRPEIAEVLGKRLRTRKQQSEAEKNHADDGRNLDQRHPELCLAIRLDIHEVQRRDGDEADERREPLRQIREPEVHVDADRRELRHRDEHVVEPVVPPREEAGEPSPVLRRVMAERARDRLIDRHLAEHAHDEENDDAAQKIREHDGRPRQRNRGRRAIEQARADGAAERNHLQMPVLQAALHLCVVHDGTTSLL